MMSDWTCDADTFSWDHFTPEQTDAYWITCTRAPNHDGEHEDANTGLTWAT